MREEKPLRAQIHYEREHTIAVLSDAFAADLLDVDEFEDRVDKAHQAEDRSALAALRQDLEVVPHSQGLVQHGDRQLRPMASTRDAAKWVVAVLGGAERRGSWRVPAKLRVCSLAGGTRIDFREAIFCPGISEVTVVAGMGGVDIIVPPDLPVECEGVGIMGAFESAGTSSPLPWPSIPGPAQPLLRIKGVAVMGAVEISTRLVGESARQARQRIRLERKAVRELSGKPPKSLGE